MSKQLLQMVDIVCLTNDGQRILVPGQCAAYYDTTGYCLDKVVAGIWLYSAVQQTWTKGYQQALIKDLLTVNSSSAAGHYMAALTTGGATLLAQPGGLTLFYSPSARAMLDKTPFAGMHAGDTRGLTRDDFDAVYAVSQPVTAVPSTGAPCLFVRATPHTAKILPQSAKVQMWCADDQAYVDMYAVGIPPLLRSISEISCSQIGATGYKAYEYIMWQAATKLGIRTFYLGWLPTGNLPVPADRLYSRTEFDALFPGPDPNNPVYPTRLRYEWDVTNTNSIGPIARNLDLMAGQWDILDEIGYVPNAQLGSVL